MMLHIKWKGIKVFNFVFFSLKSLSYAYWYFKVNNVLAHPKIMQVFFFVLGYDKAIYVFWLLKNVFYANSLVIIFFFLIVKLQQTFLRINEMILKLQPWGFWDGFRSYFKFKDWRVCEFQILDLRKLSKQGIWILIIKLQIYVPKSCHPNIPLMQ